MDRIFQDKAGKVIVIDSSGASRTLLAEVVRSLGFTDVQGVGTIKDALNVMEVEAVSWVLTPLMVDQPENAMHLMRICTEEPSQRGVRVSLLLEETEHYCLPAAFANGMVSWHAKPFTKDSLTEELKKLLANYEQNNFNGTLVAAHYLRQLLENDSKYEELLQLEKAVIRHFPSRPDLMLKLISPMCSLDQKEDAKAILRQVKLLDETLAGDVEKVKEQYLPGESLDAEGNVNFLGLDSVVIVDSDESVQNQIKEILAEIGVENVHGFSDGEQALEHLKANEEPGLLIQEWRIPKVPGPVFLQKAKTGGARGTPVVVLSSLIQDGDLPLLKEMGVANLIKKPFDKSSVLKSLVWTIQQDRSPTDQGTMERKIRQFLKEEKIEEALGIKTKFMADEHIQEGAKKAIEAEFAFAEENFEAARDYGITALKLSGDSIFILNLLGKTLMNLRDFQSALKCFDKAQSLSPLNIERLCSIAEVQSEMGDTEAADKTLEDAKQIDEESVRVHEAESKIAMNAGDTEKAKALMGQLESLSNVVSYMNNQAVTMAKVGEYERGIEQYRKCIESVPDNHTETKGVVLYNLSLAFARAGELEEAKVTLEKSAAIESKVKQKAQSLAQRITKALEEATAFTLNSDTPPAPSASTAKDNHVDEDEEEGDAPIQRGSSAQEVHAIVSSSAGDIGCFLIYQPKEIDEQAKKLLQNPPRFRVRKAIERSESGGADRIASKSA